MFQTFSGSSRRPRQVNLSGRVANPFAQPGVPSGSQAAVASAQEKRAERQRERDRLNAAKNLQRVWRGHACRRGVYGQIRQDWDHLESSGELWCYHRGISSRANRMMRVVDADTPYTSEEEAFLQLQRLLLFMDLHNAKDHTRLARYCSRSMKTAYTGGPWPMAYLRLQLAVLGTLNRQLKTTSVESTERTGGAGKHRKKASSSVLEAPVVLLSLETLCVLNDLIPKEAADKANFYYQTMAGLTKEAFGPDLQSGELNRIMPRTCSGS